MGLFRDPRVRHPAGSAHEFDYLSTFKIPAADGSSPAGSRHAVGRGGNTPARNGRADIVIVGNGIAGCTAAIEARRLAPTADITIVTDQTHPTINTPALKQFGAGHLELDQLLAQPPRTESRLRISVVNQRVAGLDTNERTLRLQNGQEVKFDRLLLATGSRPVGLPAMPGADFDGVTVLHSLADYLDLRRRLPTVSRAVVIGGGYHAAETALLLRSAGVTVSWLIRGRGLVPALLDTPASDLLIRQVQRQGVDVRLGTEVAGVVGRVGVAVGVLTTDDEFVPGQLIVAAIGVRPNTGLASGTELAPTEGSGFRVDRRLQTRVSGIHAAGAVADVRDPATGKWESRAQWYFAFQQGRLAGAALAGVDLPAGAEMSAMGSFWHATQLGGLRVLAAGAPLLGGPNDNTYDLRTNGSSSFHRRLALRDGRLVGYLAVGVDLPSGLAIKRIIDQRLDVRDIVDELLSEDFDARAHFARLRATDLRAGREQPAARQWMRGA